jgi:Lar family restriction alleviation protein
MHRLHLGREELQRAAVPSEEVTMTDELKPCPFCGSGDVEVCVGHHANTDAKVLCKTCEAESSLFGADDWTGKDYRPEAIAAWNRRSAPEVTDDTQLMDFLANPAQSVANVTLPRHIAERNIHSLRDAIADAMAEWEESKQSDDRPK